MTGNTKELYDPANAHGRVNNYPSAYYTGNEHGSQPSIIGRKLYYTNSILVFTLK